MGLESATADRERTERDRECARVRKSHNHSTTRNWMSRRRGQYDRSQRVILPSIYCGKLHLSESRAQTRRIASSGMLRRVALVRIDVSEELSASFIRVTRIGELGTTKCRFLQEPHDVTSQKTPFFIVTAVKTSDLRSFYTSYVFNGLMRQWALPTITLRNLSYPRNRLWRPIVLWDTEDSTFSMKSAQKRRWNCQPHGPTSFCSQGTLIRLWYWFLLDV
jgi:hypothetical protein